MNGVERRTNPTKLCVSRQRRSFRLSQVQYRTSRRNFHLLDKPQLRAHGNLRRIRTHGPDRRRFVLAVGIHVVLAFDFKLGSLASCGDVSDAKKKGDFGMKIECQATGRFQRHVSRRNGIQLMRF